VNAVTLTVKAGEVLALLGPNGAGKTTTIRMFASIFEPSGGWVRILGYDSVAQSEAVRRSIGMLTEHHGLYTRMRPKEYLQFFGSAHNFSKGRLRDRIGEVLKQLELEQEVNRRIGEFSKGMRQKLALARTLLHDPPVLLFDEPTSAMDPANARLVRQNIWDLRSSERAIVVCTHNLAEAEELADRIAIIQRGRIIALGTPKELKKRFLGDPIMEIRFSKPLDGAVPDLPEEARILETGAAWIRYQVAQPDQVNPQVLQSLRGLGLSVVTLAEVRRSLEDVYLRVTAEAEHVLKGEG
jgi:ABC-2 type transport system ATP-binding protein